MSEAELPRQAAADHMNQLMLNTIDMAASLLHVQGTSILCTWYGLVPFYLFSYQRWIFLVLELLVIWVTLKIHWACQQQFWAI